jgi:type II secretion system protein G
MFFGGALSVGVIPLGGCGSRDSAEPDSGTSGAQSDSADRSSRWKSGSRREDDAGIAGIFGRRNRADINNARLQLGLFKQALERYYHDVKSYPTAEQGLAALMEKPVDLDENVRWDGPYLSGDIPKDPWGREYKYEHDPDQADAAPHIWSTGPNGEDGDEDDIVGWTSSGDRDFARNEPRGATRPAEPAPDPLRSVVHGSRIKMAKAQIGNAETALECYRLDVGTYPKSLDALVQPPPAPPDASRWRGPYLLRLMPRDPWDECFRYRCPGTHNPQSFDLWSAGPDGIDGTSDDVGNWK